MLLILKLISILVIFGFCPCKNIILSGLKFIYRTGDSNDSIQNFFSAEFIYVTYFLNEFEFAYDFNSKN